MTTRCAVIAGGSEDERERRRLKMLDEGCEVVMLARDMAEAAHASVTLRGLLPGACVDVVALDRAAARFNRRHDFTARLGGRAEPDYTPPARLAPEYLESWAGWSMAER